MRKLIILAILATLSGCMSTYVPPVPQYTLPENAKVAILVESRDNPMHSHIGTTIFNNFEKTYAYDWQIQQLVKNAFTTAIESKSAMTVVDMNTLDYVSAGSEFNFVEVKDKQWQFTAENDNLRQQLLASGIHAVVVIKEVPTLAVMECGAYGCTNHYSQGVGLFTRSMFAMDNYYASASYSYQIQLLSEPVDFTMLEDFKAYIGFQSKNILLDDFEDPANFEQFSEQEMQPIKLALEGYFTNLAALTAQHLKGNSAPMNDAGSTLKEAR